MKQKMVIRVYMDSKQVAFLRKLFDIQGKKMNEKRMKAKILRTVVSVSGVDKAEFTGSDKSLVVVEGGDGFDPVELIEKLRRSVCDAVIESITPVKEDGKNESSEVEKTPAEVASTMLVPPMQWPPYYYMTIY